MKKTLAAIVTVSLGVSVAGAQSVAPPPFSLNVVDITKNGVSASAADNATALQAAINLAVANKQALYIPSASSCYKYTAPLTISGNLTIVGDYVAGNWPGASQINAPSGTPALLGSVLCPTANGSDAIDISGTAFQVNISNIGILFQTTFGQSSTTTGDGFNYIPSGTNQGLSGGVWNNVIVYGHDGNHYAFNWQNPIYGSFTALASYGGGALKLSASSTTAFYGNLVFTDFYGNLLVGGSADGVNLSASGTNRLNLIAFVRPQINTNNTAGLTPVANLPTSSQRIWFEDQNVSAIGLKCPDLETNVGGTNVFGSAAKGNDFDANCLSTSAASTSAPAWLTNGLLWGPASKTFNDSTSSGTVANTAMFAIPSNTISASSATTYTIAETLFLGTPAAGTNVTISTPMSLYALGQIYTNQQIVANNGGFISGTIQLNTNNGANTTAIGNGSTSGAISIGGGSNTTNLQSATLKATALATDATHTTRTICQDTTSNQLFFGSGTAGVCLGTSSARFKQNIANLDVGLNQIMKLRPVKYEYDAQHGDPNKTIYGFTAEDGAKVLPKLVDTDADGMPNSFDYLGVVPVLVKGMQQLKAENDNLRACNDNWKCRLLGIR